ncbi:hypothetical protein V1477_005964 [Vespula maculifrons]|uniref:Uncharacterized protein n=1 Tax=Vespula maculifrons TaxID=7453 RepID=A0ABD2CM43_VESMC
MISSVLDEFTSCQSTWSNSRHAASKAPANSNSNSSADNSRFVRKILREKFYRSVKDNFIGDFQKGQFNPRKKLRCREFE